MKLEHDKYFKGNIKEFIELCNKWVNFLIIGKEGFVPKERLIRGYVTEGILQKPERSGKESIYNYKHLIMFLACRDLLAENWQLGKIKEYFNSIEFSDLETNFLIKYNQTIPNDSLKVIEELKQKAPKNPKIGKQNFNTNMSYTSSMMSQSYQNSKQTIKEFGSDLPRVLKDEFTTFTLASWLSLAIKSNKLSKMNSDLAFRISNAVKAALLDTKLEENHEIFQNINQLSDLDIKKRQLERQIISLENKIKTHEHAYELKNIEIEEYKNFIEKNKTEMDYRLKELEITRDKQIAELKSTLENNHKNEMNKLQIQIEEKKVLLDKNNIEKN